VLTDLVVPSVIGCDMRRASGKRCTCSTDGASPGRSLRGGERSAAAEPAGLRRSALAPL